VKTRTRATTVPTAASPPTTKYGVLMNISEELLLPPLEINPTSDDDDEENGETFLLPLPVGILLHQLPRNGKTKLKKITLSLSLSLIHHHHHRLPHTHEDHQPTRDSNRATIHSFIIILYIINQPPSLTTTTTTTTLSLLLTSYFLPSSSLLRQEPFREDTERERERELQDFVSISQNKKEYSCIVSLDIDAHTTSCYVDFFNQDGKTRARHGIDHVQEKSRNVR
jgi:hypothetical protein